MSINRVMVSGNLTRDAEVKKTQNDSAIVTFGVAVNDRRKNAQTGEWEDYANFVDCTWFGKRAEACAKYLTKGAHVMLEGKLHYSSWEKDGDKRSKLEIIVDDADIRTNATKTEDK